MHHLKYGMYNATFPPDFFSHNPRFLYALFLAIDANFCLARRNVSSDIVDPGLNRGYAFFVEEHAYKDFIGSHEQVVQEVNSTFISHEH